jgi:long-subunit fatty acid transport protein
MKKIFTLILAAATCGQLFAGGILTNTNQSVMFTRMQSRDATLGIDAVYFNPAGLTLLPNNGFFLSLSNQTLGQTRSIKSNYSFLNNGDYEGEVSAPFFPSIYAAYKMDKLAFSLGFNPIGGGGGGTYERGLPSFEYAISDLVPALASQGAQAYQMNAYFEGTSAWFGYQANISYQINDMISVAIGGRFVQAKDTYNGYLRDVQLNMGGTWMPASYIMTGIADQFRPGLTATSDIVDAGYGTLTFAQAEANNIITPTQRAQLEGGITAMGLGVDPSTLTIQQAAAYYQGTVSKYDGTAFILQDQEAESEATASGFTPIISVNIKPNDQLNFSLKYEHQTKLEFTNKTAKDFTTGFKADGTPITMFPNGAKKRLDLPSQLVVGATFKPIEKLMISTGYHMYMDKNADWEGREEKLDGNSWEYALGLEYGLTEKLLVSAGWLTTKSGADGNDGLYQSDLSYSLPSNTFGGGFEYKINDMINLNLAGSYTLYSEGDKDFTHDFANSGTMLPVKETYDKDFWIVAIGVNFNFGAGK